MLSVLAFLSTGLAAQTAVYVAVASSAITTGRAQALAALGVGLISVVIGVIAMARSARNGRALPLSAVGAGAIGIVLSAIRLANSTAIGTGSGRLGAIVALVVGVIGTVLGGLAFAKRRATSTT